MIVYWSIDGSTSRDRRSLFRIMFFPDSPPTAETARIAAVSSYLRRCCRTRARGYRSLGPFPSANIAQENFFSAIDYVRVE